MLFLKKYLPNYGRALGIVFLVVVLMPKSSISFGKSSSKSQHSLDSINLSQSQNDKLSHLILTKNVGIQFDASQDSSAEECPLLTLVEKKHSNTAFKIATLAHNNSIKLEMDLGSGLVKVVHIKTPLDDEQFHRIIIVFEGTILILVVDCKQILLVNDHDMTRFGAQNYPNLANFLIYLGQQRHYVEKENQPSSNSCGKIRELTVDAGNTLAAKCPDLEVLLDNSATAYLIQKTAQKVEPNNSSSGENVEFTRSLPLTTPRTAYLPPSPPNHLSSPNTGHRRFHPSGGKSLHDKFEGLRSEVEHWSVVLQNFEARIKKIELFQRGCQLHGKFYSFGEKYQFLDNCTQCQCSASGDLHCGPIGCQKLDCPHPIHIPGKCCPECGSQCLYNGDYYESGHVFWPKHCVQCHCNNGQVECRYKQAPNCPHLDCPEHQQETPPNQCCPVCRGVDQCEGGRNPCHVYATCHSGPYSATCKCKEGYFGNGTLCYDIDECHWNEEARQMLNGCGSGTICINLPGSFKCDCLPGFKKLDDRTCIDLVRA